MEKYPFHKDAKQDPFHKHEHSVNIRSLQDYKIIESPSSDKIVDSEKEDILKPDRYASPVYRYPEPPYRKTKSGLRPEHEFDWLGGYEYDWFKGYEKYDWAVKNDRFGGFAEGEIDRLEREALDELLKKIDNTNGETADQFKARMKAQQEIMDKYTSLKQDAERFFKELKKEPITEETLEKVYAKFLEWGFKEQPSWLKYPLFPEEP